MGQPQVGIPASTTLRTLLERLALDLGDDFTGQVLDARVGLQRGVSLPVNGIHYARREAGLWVGLDPGNEIAIFPSIAGG